MKKQIAIVLTMTTLITSVALVAPTYAATFAVTTKHPFTSEETLFDASSPTQKGRTANVNVQADGSVVLGSSYQVPRAYEGATRYGVYTSEPIEANKTFQSVLPKISTDKNSQDVLIFEASVSLDGQNWSEWRESESANREIQFFQESKYVKYRMTLISYSLDAHPTVRSVGLKLRSISPERAKAFSLKSHSSAPAPKNDLKAGITSSNPYNTNCFATREGLVGSTTANGHVIQAADKFVALPSRRGLDQSVTVSANGKTFTVPVWDLGPINQNDDFWNTNYVYPYPTEPVSNRQTTGYDGYGDIPRGYGETYYAKTYNFHNGWTSSHVIGGNMNFFSSDSNPGTQLHPTKSNPNYTSIGEKNNGAEIDLSDGLWYALGMTGNGEVNVTFNWVDK